MHSPASSRFTRTHSAQRRGKAIGRPTVDPADGKVNSLPLHDSPRTHVSDASLPNPTSRERYHTGALRHAEHASGDARPARTHGHQPRAGAAAFWSAGVG